MPNSILDSLEEIKRIDANNALQSIEELGSQVQHIWDLAQEIKFSPKTETIQQVVVAGMGGSVLGTDVISSLFKEELSVPILIAPDYTVPGFVNENTLVIVSSYSGNTEETFAAAQDAHQKSAQLVAITTGGKIAKYFQNNNLPLLQYEPRFNPSQCARMGLGYSIFGQMALFAKAGLIKLDEEAFQEVLTAIAEAHLRMSQSVAQKSNLAKMLAFNLIDRIPVVTVSEHLEGIGHVFANQLNENAKTFAEYRVIPELNHHLMEGLRFPNTADNTLEFLMIHSDLYHQSNQQRMQLTEKVIEKNKLDFVRYQMTAKTKLSQAFELLVLAAYTAFYLAMLNNVNPIPNPHVDWFKEQLKK